MGKPLKVFITCSHKNTTERDELITRLALLKREGIIDLWHDNEILPGDKWRDTIFSNLDDSDLLLYLTSAQSLDSENRNEELAAALSANTLYLCQRKENDSSMQKHSMLPESHFFVDRGFL